MGASKWFLYFWPELTFCWPFLTCETAGKSWTFKYCNETKKPSQDATGGAAGVPIPASRTQSTDWRCNRLLQTIVLLIFQIIVLLQVLILRHSR
jgi:hypothetical protein